MKKTILKIMGIVLVFLLGATPVFANSHIKLMGDTSVWPQFSRVDLDALVPHARTIQAIDPNFTEDGMAAYTGIGVKKIFDLAGIPWDKGVTVIGADQYVGYLSKEQILQDMAFLVWQMNHTPLGPLKGGPLKIMFRDQARVHASCYTWYVDALVAGGMDPAVLRVQVNGNERSYTRKELVLHAGELDPRMLSIPQGCRNEFKGFQAEKKTIHAIPFSHLVKPAEIKKATRIKLIPLAGPVMTLKPDVFDSPVSIVVSCAGGALHPALGGPFSIVFPVENHPELKGMVPDPGALFFLEKIIVE
jgi:hypothetical protein